MRLVKILSLLHSAECLLIGMLGFGMGCIRLGIWGTICWAVARNYRKFQSRQLVGRVAFRVSIKSLGRQPLLIREPSVVMQSLERTQKVAPLGSGCWQWSEIQV